MEYAISKLKKQIIELVAAAYGSGVDSAQLEITVPPEAALGDLTVPCFYLAKLSRRSPNQISTDLATKIHPGGVIKAVTAAGPYLNFFIAPEIFGREALSEITSQKNKYGISASSPRRVMLEYSQPNTHKEFHIGHLRNAVLGSSLVNILSASGARVVPVNYIGDIGAHVAKCLWALQKFHQGEQPPANKGKFLGQIYTEAVNKIEANPEYKKEADEVQSKLENGDKQLLALWKETRRWSLEEFDEIYRSLGVKFAHVFFESEVEKPGKKIVKGLLEQGVAVKSEGAVIINLEKYNLKNFLLLKSDGSSLYATKDLALAQLKFKKYKIDESIVITDSRQSFYFQQLFQALKLIGFDPSDKHGASKKSVHIPYEFVTLKDGAMSSRAGNVVLFEDFLAEVKARARNETKKRHSDWPEAKLEETARALALSAIKFNMVKVGHGSIIVFDIDEALSFDGFSGPYLQYTVCRISSVLKKAKVKRPSVPESLKLSEPLEKELLLKLSEFPEALAAAAYGYEPSEIAKYLFELAHLYANFYQKLPILQADKETRRARLVISSAVKQVISNGLTILGIEVLEEM